MQLSAVVVAEPGSRGAGEEGSLLAFTVLRSTEGVLSLSLGDGGQCKANTGLHKRVLNEEQHI